MSEYQLNNVTWCMRCGVLKAGSMQTDNYEHNAGYIQR